MPAVIYSRLVLGDGSVLFVAPSSLQASATPTGVVQLYAATAAPTGWLLCDGASYTTAAQPNLFAIIGYSFGGAGVNFNVPDMRGSVPVGTGQGAGLTNRVLAATGGEEAHVLLTTELANHSHAQPAHQHAMTGFQGYTTGVSTAVGLSNAGGASDNTHLTQNTTPGNVTATGNNVAHNTMPPFVVVTYIIKT